MVNPLRPQVQALLVAMQPDQPQGAGATARDELYRLNLTGEQKTELEPLFVKIDELLNQKEERLQLANTYKEIGMKLHQLKVHDESINYHQKALDIYLHEYGENHADVAGCYCSIGLSHTLIGNALNDFEIVQKIRPDQDCCVRYKESVACYQKALDIRLALFNENHPKVADCYYLLGYAFDSLGLTEGQRASSLVHNSPSRTFAVEKIQTALSYSQKALAIYRLSYEENPKEVAATFALLSTCYDKLSIYGDRNLSNEKFINQYKVLSDSIIQAIESKKPLPKLSPPKDQYCIII